MLYLHAQHNGASMSVYSDVPQRVWIGERNVGHPTWFIIDGGEKITGLASVRGELLIFRDTDIWVLMGDSIKNYCLFKKSYIPEVVEKQRMIVREASRIGI